MLIDRLKEQSEIRFFNQLELQGNIAVWLKEAIHSKELMVININNVCDYVDIQRDNKKTEWDWVKDFPNVAPPFELMWMEFSSGNEQIAFLIHSERAEDKSWSAMLYDFYEIELESGKSVVVLVAVINILINQDGTIKQRENGGWIRTMQPPLDNPEQMETIRSDIKNNLIPAFLSLCFMNCKNITLEKSPIWSDALQKSRIRKGKYPLVRHHTIVIDGIKKIIKAASEGKEGITPKALHICRGHFKCFNEHPLFGKYKGTYWWPQTMRGSKAFGEIEKDYEIKT
jgi:hypothetical protein